MKILSAAIVVACVPFTTAKAQLGEDASYFCVVEAVGGLAFDERTKKWVGSTFRPDKKFVLRLKRHRTRVQKATFGEDTVHDYNVTLTVAGSNSPSNCGNYPDKHVTVNELGWVVCKGLGLNEYRFNLKTNRFLSAYLLGYIDGADNNDDTPNISGGTCTKID